MHSVVLKVEVENAFSDSEIFVGVLNDWFLEIALEIEDLRKSNYIDLKASAEGI
jgi:hypothetical protein